MIYIGEKRKRRERGSTYWSFGRDKEEDSRKGDLFLENFKHTLRTEDIWKREAIFASSEEF